MQGTIIINEEAVGAWCRWVRMVRMDGVGDIQDRKGGGKGLEVGWARGKQVG